MIYLLNKEFSVVLKKLRKEKKLSTEYVVEKLKEYGENITAKTLYGYECGNRMPNADMLLYLCDIYEVEEILPLFGYGKASPHQNIVSATEYALIEKYRALEVKDKAAVNAVVSTYFSNVGSATTSSAM